MIIITNPDITQDQLDHIREQVEARGMKTKITRGERQTIIGCIGDDDVLREMALHRLPGVQSVVPVMKPYKLASRQFSACLTEVRVGDGSDQVIGGDAIAVIAGPCSVESRAMLRETALSVRDSGAIMLRGGACKPRTSPYSFQGLGREALEIMAEVRAETGLPIVTEVMDTRQVELVAEHADMLQIGARNMQNVALLAEVGRVQRPVLLKRGLSATITELLMSAEYIMAHGNMQVVLCERGIRTFENATRNTLDISAVPVVHALSHLPVMVDPSHSGGRRDLVVPLSRAAIAVGADGIIVDVHPHPEQALCDTLDRRAAVTQAFRVVGGNEPRAEETDPWLVAHPGDRI